jgi:uncharacterized protein DUF1236
MSNRFLISVAALALVAGTGFANAQGTGNSRESGGAGMHQNSPSTSGGAASERGGGAMEHRESSQPGMKSSQSEQNSKSSTVGQSQRDDRSGSGMKSTESERGKSPTVGQNPRNEENAGQKSKSMSSEDMKGGKEMKAQGREGHDGKMNPQGAENRNQPQGEQGRAATSEQGRTGTSAQGREGTSSSQTTTTTGQAAGGAKLSTEQRTQISTVIRDQHVSPVSNVNFSVSVGTRIPREGISLHPLPSRVVEIYPQWRGYEFVLVRDEIVVVDPRSFEIVAVLPA